MIAKMIPTLLSILLLLSIGLPASAQRADSDGDSIDDSLDNCPDIYNTEQADSDGDGVGDFCDVCPRVFNPGQDEGDCSFAFEIDTVWVRRFDTTANSVTYGRCRAIAATADGGYFVLAAHPSDYFVMRLNAAGDSLWSFDVPFEPADMILSASGGFLLGAALDSSDGQSYMAVVEFDSLGNAGWTAVIDAHGPGEANRLKDCSSGKTAVIGTCGDAAVVALLDSTGGVTWTTAIDSLSQPLEGTHIDLLPNGHVVAAGHSGEGGSWFAELDDLGTPVWKKAFACDRVRLAGVDYDHRQDQLLATGYVTSSGATHPFYFAYAIALDTNGDSLWASSYAYGCCPHPLQLTMLDDGTSLTLGVSHEYYWAASALYKFDPNGNMAVLDGQIDGLVTASQSIDVSGMNSDSTFVIGGAFGAWHDPPPHAGGLFVAKYRDNTYTAVACGDIDSDGVGPNIADLIYLVAFMFQDGPAPADLSLADVDGNGEGPNIADLIHLVTFMFQEGPELDCP